MDHRFRLDLFGRVPRQNRFARPVWTLLLAGAVLGSGCSAYQPFDADRYVGNEASDKVPEELRPMLRLPFELSEATTAAVQEILSPAGSEKRRTEDIIDYIFSGLDLQYSLTPTRDANETFFAREGNCMSFVNLFVGIARAQRLNPFYVEVEDYQRWNYQDGVVVSRGHIVAGMTIDGDLSTFDFLPYKPKSYRDFRPIDDLTAMAHFYNNLGAEELMRGSVEAAEPFLRIATALAPDFEKAVNNLGVVYLRTRRNEEARSLLEQGVEFHPESVPLLSNLARTYQQSGEPDKAEALLSRLEEVNETNPFFFVYRGDLALSQGDAETALEYMRQALRTDSEVPEVHVGLAKVFIAVGDVERARHHVERALRLDATHREARKYAAMLGGDSRGR